MTSNLFKPDSATTRSLKLGREKLRKYGFTNTHEPFLLKESIMSTETNPALVPLASVPTKAKSPAKAAKLARKAPAKKVATKTPTPKAKADSSGKVALKTICQELKLDSKAARVKLRRNADKLGFHNKTDRWMFTELQAAKVREVLGS